MSSREAILTRIREALRVAAPRPGHQHGELKGEHGGLKVVREDGATVTQPASPAFEQWLPPVGPTHEEQMALFCRNADDLRAEVHLCDDEAAMAAMLCQLARENGWKRVGTHRGVLTDGAMKALPLPVVQTTDGYSVEDLEQCDAGVTECDALIAQTGSVLITSQSAGGRGLSILPPHHVVLVRRSQLIADLAAGYALLRAKHGDTLPSLISFITGPSRTGDIERILVLGAHGPKRLTILCCNG